jgi:apolipoprotein N-acyltransferase
MAYGTFICQEVLIPSLLRRSVLDGAEILVSGGNDGVFASPAVAAAHAAVARIRAVESGRYVLRAMKTGVSAIISPTGEEITRSTSAETALLKGQVEARRHLTPYVRFGPWPLWLSVAVILGALVLRLPRVMLAARRRAVGKAG